jgi:ribonuclease P protein subunit RPR2
LRVPRQRRPAAEVARERVEHLLDLAERAAREGRTDRAARYGELAWRVVTRHTLDAPDRLKARVCRGCKVFLLPGATARVRTTGGKVSTTCTECGHVRRVPVTREQAAGRRG